MENRELFPGDAFRRNPVRRRRSRRTNAVASIVRLCRTSRPNKAQRCFPRSATLAVAGKPCPISVILICMSRFPREISARPSFSNASSAIFLLRKPFSCKTARRVSSSSNFDKPSFSACLNAFSRLFFKREPFDGFSSSGQNLPEFFTDSTNSATRGENFGSNGTTVRRVQLFQPRAVRRRGLPEVFESQTARFPKLEPFFTEPRALELLRLRLEVLLKRRRGGNLSIGVSSAVRLFPIALRLVVEFLARRRRQVVPTTL